MIMLENKVKAKKSLCRFSTFLWSSTQALNILALFTTNCFQEAKLTGAIISFDYHLEQLEQNSNRTRTEL